MGNKKKVDIIITSIESLKVVRQRETSALFHFQKQGLCTCLNTDCDER